MSTRAELQAQLDSLTAALAANADAQTVALAEANALRQQVADLTARLNTDVAQIESLQLAATALLARRDQVAAAIASLPVPLTFAGCGFVPAGSDIQATVSAKIGQTWNPYTVELPPGETRINTADKTLRWRTADGSYRAFMVIQGAGKDVSTLVGNVQTCGYGMVGGNEAFGNSLYDFTLAGNLEWNVNNKGVLRRVRLNGNLNTKTDWTGPALVIDSEINGTIDTHAYHSPIIYHRSSIGNTVTNYRDGITFSRCGGTAEVRNTHAMGTVTIVDSPALKLTNLAGSWFRRESGKDTASKDLTPATPSLMLPAADPPADPAGTTVYLGGGNDTNDDTAALQKAIDSGAAVVILPRGVYCFSDSVNVGAHKVLLRFNDSRLDLKGKLDVADAALVPLFKVAAGGLLVIDRCNQFGGDGKSAQFFDCAGTVVVRDTRVSCEGKGVVRKGGVYFAENVNSMVGSVPGNLTVEAGATAHLVHYNPEHQDPQPKVINYGTVRAVGYKSEGKGTEFRCFAGSKTEVLGGLIYHGGSAGFPAGVAVFDLRGDARLTLGGVYEGADYSATNAELWVSRDGKSLLSRGGTVGRGEGCIIPRASY